jgi:hypothetical protein
MFQVVGHMYNKIVAPVSNDGWPWDGAIEGQRLAQIAIWGKCCIFN